MFVRARPPFTVDPKRSIVQLDLASGGERVVARLPHRLFPADWSPDLRRVALIRLAPVDQPGPGPLLVLDIATGRLQTLLRSGVDYASWSPDGRPLCPGGNPLASVQREHPEAEDAPFPDAERDAATVRCLRVVPSGDHDQSQPRVFVNYVADNDGRNENFLLDSGKFAEQWRPHRDHTSTALSGLHDVYGRDG